MKKNLIADVKSAFPKWLMDLALLIQSENVQVAIQKSREHIPVILKEEVNTLVERLTWSRRALIRITDFSTV